MTAFVEDQQSVSLIHGHWFWVERKGPLPASVPPSLPPNKALSTTFIFTRSCVAEGVFSGSVIIT